MTTGATWRRAQRGEFLGTGSQLLPGVLPTAAVCRRALPADGWFMSGDIMTRNADDTFTYVARTDDMINRGGQKLDPREVEELLYQHPKVSHVAVVAMPDARLGQKGCACVVPAEGASLTLGELQAFLAEKGLGQVQVARALELLERASADSDRQDDALRAARPRVGCRREFDGGCRDAPLTAGHRGPGSAESPSAWPRGRASDLGRFRPQLPGRRGACPGAACLELIPSLDVHAGENPVRTLWHWKKTSGYHRTGRSCAAR